MSIKKVLLISSDPNFFESPDNAFQVRGCDIFTAQSGEEAVEFLETYGAELVIAHGIPRGVSPSRLHTAVGAEGHVVIIASKGDDGEPLAAYRKLGGVHVIDDPISQKSLLKLSARLLSIPNRKYISILVQVKVAQPKPTTIFGKSRDISERGLLVETNQSLTMHDQVVVSFLIPGAEKMIQAQALVSREVDGQGGPRRYGLKFLNLSEDEQRIIGEYLSGQPTRVK